MCHKFLKNHRSMKIEKGKKNDKSNSDTDNKNK